MHGVTNPDNWANPITMRIPTTIRFPNIDDYSSIRSILLVDSACSELVDHSNETSFPIRFHRTSTKAEVGEIVDAIYAKHSVERVALICHYSDHCGEQKSRTFAPRPCSDHKLRDFRPPYLTKHLSIREYSNLGQPTQINYQNRK